MTGDESMDFRYRGTTYHLTYTYYPEDGTPADDGTTGARAVVNSVAVGNRQLDLVPADLLERMECAAFEHHGAEVRRMWAKLKREAKARAKQQPTPVLP